MTIIIIRIIITIVETILSITGVEHQRTIQTAVEREVPIILQGCCSRCSDTEFRVVLPLPHFSGEERGDDGSTDGFLGNDPDIVFIIILPNTLFLNSVGMYLYHDLFILAHILREINLRHV